MNVSLHTTTDTALLDQHFRSVTSFDREQASILLHFLDACEKKDILPDRPLVIKLVELYQQWFKDLANSWFRKRKLYSNDHLASLCFKPAPEKCLYKCWANSHLQVIDITLTECLNILRHEDCGEATVFRSELRLASRLVEESFTFIDIASGMITGTTAGIQAYRRYLMCSTEAFDGSKLLVRRHVILNTIGEFAIVQSAAILIRQSLELRLKNMWGIDLIETNDVLLNKIPYEFILSFMKQRATDIEMPVKMNIITEIFKMANATIHMGWTPFIWSILFAQKLLLPLFSAGRHKGTWSIFGSVKIRQSAYDDFEIELITELTRRGVANPKLIRSSYPEVLLT